MLKRYKSVGDFARHCEGIKSPYSAGKWTSYLSFEQARDKALLGDKKYVPEAQKLMKLLDANVQTPKSEWQASMMGAYPIVPEFLAGSPTPMRRRVDVEGSTSPIRIFVSTTCSASIDDETMLKRGVAILALVMKMQAIRPIELCLLAETHGATDGEYLQVIPIHTKPLAIAIAAFALCNVGFARQLTYSVAKRDDKFNGSWPNGYEGGGAKWESHVRQVLKMADIDLYIGAARDWDDMVTKPVEWVNSQVKRFTKGLGA